MKAEEIEAILANANHELESTHYPEASKLFMEALLESTSVSDYSRQIHALSGLCLVYKHLSRSTQLKFYKTLTESFGRAGVEVLEEKLEHIDPRTQSIALGTYADALFQAAKFQEAIPYFEKSILVSPADLPEKGRLKAHLAGVRYLLGTKKEAIADAEKALKEIQTGDPDKYEVKIWETGALNTLAKMYAMDHQKNKAIDTINLSIKKASDQQLMVRLQEAKIILEKINNDDFNFPL